MSKRKIISIAGDLGSGKSTISSMISEKLSYPLHKNGDFFRDLGAQMGFKVTEFNKYVEDHPEIDIQIENSSRKAADENEELIIDARLGWYAVPESFKVYLTVDIDEAARRAFNDAKRKSSESFETLEEHKEDLEKRFNLENERYFKLYGVRKEDKSNYDFVLDTTTLTREEVVEKVLKAYNEWLEEE